MPVAKQKEVIHEAKISLKMSLARKWSHGPPLTVNMGKQQRSMGRPELVLELGIYRFQASFVGKEGRKEDC